MAESSKTNPQSLIPKTLHPIRKFDANSWHKGPAVGSSSAVEWNARRSRSRRPDADTASRLVFSSLQILLEQICTDEPCARSVYGRLQKKLKKFFSDEATPTYDAAKTLMLTNELTKAIFDIAQRENISIHLDRIPLANIDRSLVPRAAGGIRQAAGAQNFAGNYILIKELGEGGFGKVYHARNKLDHVDYAVKAIPLPVEEDSPTQTEKVLKEVLILAKLDHHNVVRYHTAWCEEAPLPPAPACFSPEDELARAFGPSSPPSGAGVVIEEMTGSPTGPAPPLALPDLGTSDLARPSPWSDEWSSDSDAPSASSTSVSLPVARRGLSRRRGHGPGPLVVDGRGDRRCRCRPVLYIQMQLCDISLREWLAARNAKISATLMDAVDRKQNLSLFEQMARGLEYIHSRDMIHRDIKPANVLLIERADGGLEVKLADFGLTTYLPGCASSSSSLGPNGLLSGRIGTRFYASPEQQQGGSYDQAADLFSLGLILFELFQPYGTESELIDLTAGLRRRPVLLHAAFEARWPAVAETVKALVDADPARRPTASQLLTDSPVLHNWRRVASENEHLHQQVAFLTSQLRAKDKEIESLRRRLRDFEPSACD